MDVDTDRKRASAAGQMPCVSNLTFHCCCAVCRLNPEDALLVSLAVRLSMDRAAC